MLNIDFQKNSISENTFIGPLTDTNILEEGIVSDKHELNVKDAARSFSVLALYLEGGMLLVDEYSATNTRENILKLIKRLSEENVDVNSVRIMSNTDLNEVIDKLLGSSQSMGEANEVSSSDSMRMFDQIVNKASLLDAQDIFIRLSQSQNSAYVMFKVEGEFTDQIMSLRDYKFGKSICAAIYDGKEGAGQSGDNFDDSTTPQECQFYHVIYNEFGHAINKLNIRFAKSKTSKPGEMLINLRLIPEGRIFRLHEMGLEDDVLNAILKRIKRSRGAIVTSGPTGAGKSTTLFAGLLEYPRVKSIQTFEDPIEIPVPKEYQNIVQNSIDKVLGHKNQLKAILRQAPDGIYVTETRDEETADFVFYVAKSGHFVMTTVHANNAIGVVDRLLDLGVSRSDLAAPGALSLLMAQRLIRKICNDCALNADEIQKLHPDIFTEKENDLRLMGLDNINGIDSKIRFSNPEGCPKCNNKGEIGRKLVIEYIEITDIDREFILKGDMEGWRKKLSEDNFKSIESQLINHVKSGIIDGSRATEQME
jgi:general secretion pathway protein E